MSERAAIERLRRELQRRRLLFIEVGPRVGTDRVISTATELPGGAMVHSREHTALLRAIVRLSQPRGKR